eukprot:gene16174-biopygen23247
MAQEQQGEVTWEQSNLTRGKVKRYKPVDPAAIRWLPHTGQRRWVMYPEEPGQFDKECRMYHEDAGKEKGGVVQTGIATGVEITEGRIKVWTCPQPSTTQEGEATHLPITLQHIVQQEEKGECGQDTTHVITVDSGSTLANWIAACDERDKQAWERQLSTFAVETRRAWANQCGSSQNSPGRKRTPAQTNQLQIWTGHEGTGALQSSMSWLSTFARLRRSRFHVVRSIALAAANFWIQYTSLVWLVFLPHGGSIPPGAVAATRQGKRTM